MNCIIVFFLIRYGVGKIFEYYVIEMMKCIKFLLNMDESICISNNFYRVLIIFISFYCFVMR